ncbi:alpha/beta hydrolase [Virgibacillus sp. 179-BFC.A HS]|uniref:Alpha/beta hydrolase n=1 Tax=Tigheibacillus jepli TaxID=3035914 RepID=A0ABU5CJ40_9BACI|nr:alpha/beta hydrolase [Virgibacillus sp. 179-BFC.A HS]MDY0406353.1 alpha/beta hydrolase [Virgibacillus sp. 179-BFC.A HS]
MKQVQKATVPILYIHGNTDTFVPTKMTHKLYEHTKSPAEILTVDGANHGESYVLARDKYIAKLNHFLGEYVGE